MKHCPNADCVHLAETGRAGEFRDEILRCSDCGAELAAGPPPEAERGRLAWSRLETPLDAHALRLARAALESAGIPSVTQQAGKTGRMLTPGAPAEDLYVPEHLAADAALVLEQALHDPVPLPDDEDLEFVGEDERPIEGDDATRAGSGDAAVSSEAAPSMAGGAPAAACPRCGSACITRSPEPVGERRGLLARLLRSPRTWHCLACTHRW